MRGVTMALVWIAVVGASGGCTALLPFDFNADAGTAAMDGGADDAGTTDAAPLDGGAMDAATTDGGAPDAGLPEPCAALDGCATIPANPAAPTGSCPPAFYRARDGSCGLLMVPAIGAACFDVPTTTMNVTCDAGVTPAERWQGLVDAVDALSTSGGVITLGPCDYTGSGSALVVSSAAPLVIQGAGPSTVLRSNCRDCTNAGLRIQSPGVVVRDLEIFASSTSVRAALVVQATEDVIIERVTASVQNGFGARITNSSRVAVRESDFEGTVAGLLVIGRPAEDRSIALLGSRFAARGGGASLDIRGVSSVEVAGTEHADSFLWTRMRSLDRAWFHHITVTNSGAADYTECDSAMQCTGEPVGDIAIHDVSVPVGLATAVRTDADGGRVFVFRLSGISHAAEVSGTTTRVWTCMDDGLTVTPATRQVRFDCSGYASCTAGLFIDN